MKKTNQPKLTKAEKAEQKKQQDKRDAKNARAREKRAEKKAMEAEQRISSVSVPALAPGQIVNIIDAKIGTRKTYTGLAKAASNVADSAIGSNDAVADHKVVKVANPTFQHPEFGELEYDVNYNMFRATGKKPIKQSWYTRFLRWITGCK